MLTSRAGQIKKYIQQAGFTLVEILVVLMIFGIMASAVVLNLPSRKNPLYEFGNQMATNLERAAQSSLVNQQTLGVKFSAKGYEIVRYSEDAWQKVRAYEFTESFLPQMVLKINGAKIDLEDPQIQGFPIIRFDITGLATPFDLTLESGPSSLHLIGNHTGKISVKRGEFDDE